MSARSCCASALALLLAATAGPAAEPEVYVVHTQESRVLVRLGRTGLLKLLGHEHQIHAPLSRGQIEVHRDHPQSSRVDLEWRASALAIVPGTEPEKDVPVVEERMRGPEVLDVEQHETIRFWSFETLVEKAQPEAGRWRLRLRGGLELKGQRHRVEIPLEVRLKQDELVASGEVELELRRLGLQPPSVAGVVKVSDRFHVRFEIMAKRQPDGPRARDDRQLAAPGRRRAGSGPFGAFSSPSVVSPRSLDSGDSTRRVGVRGRRRPASPGRARGEGPGLAADPVVPCKGWGLPCEVSRLAWRGTSETEH